jgi:hypothetical protein
MFSAIFKRGSVILTSRTSTRDSSLFFLTILLAYSIFLSSTSAYTSASPTMSSSVDYSPVAYMVHCSRWVHTSSG